MFHGSDRGRFSSVLSAIHTSEVPFQFSLIISLIRIFLDLVFRIRFLFKFFFILHYLVFVFLFWIVLVLCDLILFLDVPFVNFSTSLGQPIFQGFLVIVLILSLSLLFVFLIHILLIVLALRVFVIVTLLGGLNLVVSYLVSIMVTSSCSMQLLQAVVLFFSVHPLSVILRFT